MHTLSNDYHNHVNTSETGSDTEFGYEQCPEEVQKAKAGWVKVK